MTANPQNEYGTASDTQQTKIDLAPILAERMTLAMLFDLAEKGRAAYFAAVRAVDANNTPENVALKNELRHCMNVASRNYKQASHEYWSRVNGEEADYRDEKNMQEDLRRGG